MEAQLYCITCRTNGWKYWGIVYQKNKTYLNRFDEHMSGKGGKYLYQGVKKYGCDSFFVELIEEGEFNYIHGREILESKNTLFKQNKGWNGNSGYAIFNTQESIDKRKATISKLSEYEYKNWRQSIPNNWRGKTKYNSIKLRKQSVSLKKRWESPTPQMILGKMQEAKTKKGRNKFNHNGIKQQSIKMKGRFLGLKNPSWRGFWLTPYGKYNTLHEAGVSIGYKIPENVRILCKTNKIITKCICKNTNLSFEYIGKRSFEIGFGFIPKCST